MWAVQDRGSCFILTVFSTATRKVRRQRLHSALTQKAGPLRTRASALTVSVSGRTCAFGTAAWCGQTVQAQQEAISCGATGPCREIGPRPVASRVPTSTRFLLETIARRSARARATRDILVLPKVRVSPAPWAHSKVPSEVQSARHVDTANTHWQWVAEDVFRRPARRALPMLQRWALLLFGTALARWGTLATPAWVWIAWLAHRRRAALWGLSHRMPAAATRGITDTRRKVCRANRARRIRRLLCQVRAMSKTAHAWPASMADRCPSVARRARPVLSTPTTPSRARSALLTARRARVIRRRGT